MFATYPDLALNNRIAEFYASNDRPALHRRTLGFKPQ